MARQYAQLQKLAQVALGAVVTAAGSQTSIGASGSLSDFISGLVILIAAPVTGTTPSLTINFQTAPDNATWTTQATFTVTAAGVQVASVDQFAAYARLNCSAATGTSPSATLTMLMQALGFGKHDEPWNGTVVTS